MHAARSTFTAFSHTSMISREITPWSVLTPIDTLKVNFPIILEMMIISEKEGRN
jgi:hypothetical protein